MQHPIICSHCAKVIPASVPDLTGEIWHTDCPACGGVTELKVILGDPEELPSFTATGAAFIQLRLSGHKP